MGVNMRILHCYGVKIEKLDSIPESKREEYEDNFCNLEYKDTYFETHLPVIFGDCYCGHWEFFGVILNSTHDFEHEGWDDFIWKIDKEYKDENIKCSCSNYGLPEPEHYVLTYYS
jgi:hypothetical protein